MEGMVEHQEDETANTTQTSLLDQWTLWAHLPHDTNWNLESYKQIGTNKTIEEALTLFENLPDIMVKNCMLFLMRKGIQPIWEDEKNRNGGILLINYHAEKARLKRG